MCGLQPSRKRPFSLRDRVGHARPLRINIKKGMQAAKTCIPFLMLFYCALDPRVTFSVSTLPSRSTCKATVSPMDLSFR